MQRDLDRREFIAASAAVSAALITSAAVRPDTAAAAADPQPPGKLHIQPRYHRWHVDPGVEWVETNTQSATLDWTLPTSQAAIVVVDVWDRHYLRDTQARAEVIIRENLAPLLDACRQAGLLVIHAPSPPQATQHPNWKPLAAAGPARSTADDWPPPAFRGKSGEYRAYARPAEPREPELAKLRAGLQIHPLVQPQGDEPVVATGAELHALCRERGIMFLFYVGFNTNACILVRDYGTLAMSQRGYEVILVRDCTTGMESRETQPELAQTNGAVLLLEMFGQYSTTSGELIKGLGERA